MAKDKKERASRRARVAASLAQRRVAALDLRARVSRRRGFLFTYLSDPKRKHVFSMSKIFFLCSLPYFIELSHVSMRVRVMSMVSRDAGLAAHSTRLLDNNVSTAPRYMHL
jgi:hypothetical protein